jgi:8-oxo-dGTP pyrophosphatase MutT (NUDIX family)
MIKSAGGIVYYIDEEGQPRFLILKRHALSKKIEWIAPKGKIKENELPDQAAIREVYEETGIHPNFIENQGHI